MKQVSQGHQADQDFSKTVSDRSIIDFLKEEIKLKGAKEYIPDTNTDARDRETKDPRNVLSWAAVVNAYCKELYPHLVLTGTRLL